MLTADASASCKDAVATANASSVLAALYIDGKAIEITGEKNQKIVIGPLTITVNEQTGTCDYDSANAEVIALHVHVDQLADVVVSDAEAGIVCRCGI